MPDFNVSGMSGDLPDDLSGMGYNPSSQGPSGNPQMPEGFEDIVFNDLFPGNSGGNSGNRFPDRSGRISGQGDFKNYEYAAIESLVSQLLSRTVGTSFYPIVTALRLARTAAQESTGETLGLNDIVKFTIDSTKEMIGGMFGFSGKPEEASEQFEELNSSIDDTISSFNDFKENLDSLKDLDIEEIDQDAIDLKNIKDSTFYDTKTNPLDIEEIEPVNEVFSDAENQAIKFLKEGGTAGADVLKKSAMLKRIAGLAGVAATAVFAIDLVVDATKQLMQAAQDAIKLTSDVAVNSIANADSMSAVDIVGRGMQIGTDVFTAGSGVAGASIGAMIGSALFPGIGTLIGGLMGKYLGGALGEKISGLVATAVSILSDIDAGIQQLSSDLMPFSGELITAFAERDISLLQDDMRRADLLGGVLADNVDARTEFALELRKIGDSLTLFFAPIITTIYDLLTDILAAINALKSYLPSVDIIQDAITAALDTAAAGMTGNPVFAMVLSTLSGIIKAVDYTKSIRDALENKLRTTEIDTFLNPETNFGVFGSNQTQGKAGAATTPFGAGGPANTGFNF